MDIAEKFILSRRLITDSHRDHLGAAHEIVEIISAVRAYNHVGSRKAVRHADFRCSRILLPLKNAAVISPVAEIIHRCRPAHIISQAEVDAVKKIM